MNTATLQRAKTPAPAPAPGSVVRPSQAAPPLKRQMTGSSSASYQSSSSYAPSTAAKRARTNTLIASSAVNSSHVLQASQAANIQRPMYTGSSTISSLGFAPLTPCPPSFANSAGMKSHNLMLATPSTHSVPASSLPKVAGPPICRLPLKAQTTANWQHLGIGRQTFAGQVTAAQSLSSLQATGNLQLQRQLPAQTRTKQSFRPRPSILNNGQVMGSTSSGSSWGARTVSSATSVDSLGSVC